MNHLLDYHNGISFCTVVMNRLHHLQETLPANMKMNSDYPRLEFVVLDYNSSDHVGEWLQRAMAEPLREGRLRYYRTDDPPHFDRAHSRNMAMRLASGEIVVNIDADNFAGEGFAWYLDAIFRKDRKIFSSMDVFDHELSAEKDIFGRIAMNKNDFESVSGFDECMHGYGFEDFDIIQRLKMNHGVLVPLDDPNFFKSIQHPEAERYNNEAVSGKLPEVFIQHINPGISELIYLFNDGSLGMGRIVDRFRHFPFPLPRELYAPEIPRRLVDNRWGLEGRGWTKGSWKATGDCLRLEFEAGGVLHLPGSLRNPEALTTCDSAATSYQMITEPGMRERCSRFYSLYENLAKMEFNLTHRVIRPNQTFGVGTVVRNFNPSDRVTLA